MKESVRIPAPEAFRRLVYRNFQTNGRDLPWRCSPSPYGVLVSELMLQQTQVPRVVEKYNAFMKRFPDIGTLARARLGSVLRQWQGLGYNRRARYLHQAARAIQREHGGRVPSDEQQLLQLPGIGLYTARAIRAFAYNEPVVFIETNIRSALLHHFFPSQEGVRDELLLPLVTELLDSKHPRRWYSALMDYGAYLKMHRGNDGRRSAHYTKQSRFKGSDRQLRGEIIRVLSLSKRLTMGQLRRSSSFEADRVRAVAADLVAEGIIIRRKHYYSLP